jgi:hypothetical protein
MALGYLETKTLQALRAGPMESWQLIERLGSAVGLRKLISLGYAKDVEGVYSITQAGKENCPTRRSTENFSAPVKENKTISEIDIPVFINAGLPIKGPSMESTQSSVADELKATDQPKNDTPSEPVVGSDTPDYSDKPKAYQILKYIENNPGCSSKPIQNILGLTSSIKPYIAGYLNRGEGIQLEDDLGLTYQVTKPVDDFYRHHKPYAKKSPGAKHETTSTAVHAQEMQSVEQVKPVSTDETVKEKSENHTSIKAENDLVSQSKVRFAITSDKHIILMGLTPDDIELTEGDSHTLIQFCGDIALAANVSSVLANRVIDLETLGS